MTMLDTKAPRQSEKFAERRAELAQAALHTLGELGYARTSLREIAQNSEFSHGVLHYYFRDKVDLITCSVRDYKAHCVLRYDRITADATSFDDLVDGFADGLAMTLRDEAPMHRLWYDLRAQALFEPAFRADVLEIDRSLENMIFRIVKRAAELARADLRLGSAAIYAAFDGLFQQCLLRHLAGEPDALAGMKDGVRRVMAAITG